jgi:peptidoglycan-associated lipoprotein
MLSKLHNLSAHRKIAPGVAVLACAMALAACSKKPPAALPPEPAPAVTQAPPPPPPANQGPIPGSAADFVAQMMGRDTIHFALDKYSIDPSDLPALQAQAQWLLKYPAKKATIEGHCDERGTREYNLALGERRATAAKNYLVSLGVDASRLTTISYGKERPIDPASTEEAWAKNRRAVTVAID